MPSILSRHPDATLLCVGAGPELGRSRALARELGVGASVRFLGQRGDAVGVMCACDVIVQPSLAEGLGLAVLEAMALGRPVVVSDVGGLREVVKHGETGLLVRCGNIAALADAMLRLLRDRELAQRLQAGGPQRVDAQFTICDTAAAVQSLYAELGELPA